MLKGLNSLKYAYAASGGTPIVINDLKLISVPFSGILTQPAPPDVNLSATGFTPEETWNVGSPWSPGQTRRAPRSAVTLVG
eukprot:199252-Pleurochrysis_carterae.AAC.2